MNHSYYPHGKRLFDLTLLFFAVPTFILLSPLLLFLILALHIESPGPVFFSQIRAGYRGRPFRIYKFRTLVVNEVDPLTMPDGHGHVLATPVGSIIRRFRLDELPQLWNVLKGEMSLVGPRPVFLEIVAEYSAEHRRRLDVLPGLTGWAQVNGNNMLTWDKRIRLDLWYVDHVSLLTDLRILLMTCGVVLKGDQISEEAMAEADEHLASLRPQGFSIVPEDRPGKGKVTKTVIQN